MWPTAPGSPSSACWRSAHKRSKETTFWSADVSLPGRGGVSDSGEDARAMSQEEHSALHLAWDACYNVRDLGGYPTERGGRIRPQALVRADNLCRLTPTGQAALRAYGI